jgi:hypothetical protein
MTRTRWRRVRDSNPRYLAVHTLSKRAPSTTRPSLQEILNFSSSVGERSRPDCAHAPSQSLRPVESITGGEGGIRTLDRLLTYTPLAGARFQPAQPPLRGRGTISYRRTGAGPRGPEFQGKSPLRMRNHPPTGRATSERPPGVGWFDWRRGIGYRGRPGCRSQSSGRVQDDRGGSQVEIEAPGGEGGIRTLEGRESLPVFKTGAFNRSATSPQEGEDSARSAASPQAGLRRRARESERPYARPIMVAPIRCRDTRTRSDQGRLLVTPQLRSVKPPRMRSCPA